MKKTSWWEQGLGRDPYTPASWGPVLQVGDEATFKGWTVEGGLTIHDDGQRFVPKGWDRLRVAVRALRGKPLRVPSSACWINGNAFVGGLTSERPRE